MPTHRPPPSLSKNNASARFGKIWIMPGRPAITLYDLLLGTAGGGNSILPMCAGPPSLSKTKADCTIRPLLDHVRAPHDHVVLLSSKDGGVLVYCPACRPTTPVQNPCKVHAAAKYWATHVRPAIMFAFFLAKDDKVRPHIAWCAHAQHTCHKPMRTPC